MCCWILFEYKQASTTARLAEREAEAEGWREKINPAMALIYSAVWRQSHRTVYNGQSQCQHGKQAVRVSNLTT